MYYRNDTNAVIEDNGFAYCHCGQSRAVKLFDYSLMEDVVIVTCDTCYEIARPHQKFTDIKILLEYGDQIRDNVYYLNGNLYEMDSVYRIREWNEETIYKIIAPNGEIVGYERTREQAEQKAREMMGEDILNETQHSDYWVTWDE